MSENKTPSPWAPFLEGLSGLKSGPGALVAKEWERWIGENLGRAERLARPLLSSLDAAETLRTMAKGMKNQARDITKKSSDVDALNARIAELEATVARLSTPKPKSGD